MAHQIALIPGDGIGKEVVPEGVRALEALAAKYGFDISFTPFPYRYPFRPRPCDSRQYRHRPIGKSEP